MIRHRYLYALLAMLLIFAIIPSYGTPQAKLTLLRVGYNSSLPPYEYEEGQKPAGFSISLMENFARKRSYQIKWVPMDYEDLLPAVIENKVDMAVGIGFSEELLSKVEFSSGYVQTNTVIAYNPRSGIYEPEQLALKRMVVTSGANKKYHMESLAIGDADRYLNTVRALASVNDRDHDATLAPEATVEFCRMQKKMNQLETLPLPLSDRSVCVVARLGQLALIQSFNESVQSMYDDGSYAKYKSQWLDPYLPKVNPYKNLWWQLSLLAVLSAAFGGFGVYRYRRFPEPPPATPSLEQLGVQGGQEGIWLLDLDTGVLRVNHLLVRMFSLPADSDSQMVASFMRHIPEPYRKLVSEYITDCACNKREGYDLVHPINSIDGQVRWLSNHASVVMRGEQGVPKMVAGTCRDVTDIAITMHEFKAQNEYHESLLNTIHNVLLILDENHRIQRCNAHTERVLGIRRDRVIGLNFITTFIPKLRQDDLRSRFVLLLTSTDTTSIEENLVTSSGQIRRFRWNISRMVGPDKVLRWALIGDDITGQIAHERRSQMPSQTLDLKGQLYRHLAQHAEVAVLGQSLANSFVDTGYCDAVWIGSYDRKNATWTPIAAQATDNVAGFTINTAEKWGLLSPESPLTLAGNTQQFYQLSQLSTNRISEVWWNYLAAHGIETILVQPMVWRERLVGVILGLRKAAAPIELDQQIYLNEVADAMCFGLVLSDMNDLLP